MLQGIRKVSENKVFKVLLFAVLLAFITWGASDMAKVGSSDIAASDDFGTITERDVQNFINLRSIFGEGHLSKQDAFIRVLHQKIFGAMLNLMDVDADPHHGLKNEDVIRVRGMLRQIGLSESEYIDIVTGAMRGSLLMDVFGKMYVSSFFTDLFVKGARHVRTVNIVSSKIDPKPFLSQSEDKVREFYQQNAELFRRPESRDAQFLIITGSDKYKKSIDMISQGTNIGELSELLNTRICNVENVLFETVHHDHNFKDSGTSGKKTLAKSAKNECTLSAEIIKKIFAQQDSEVSYPEDLGDDKFVIIKLDKIHQSDVSDFSAVKEEAAQMLAAKLAQDDARNKVQAMYSQNTDHMNEVSVHRGSKDFQHIETIFSTPIGSCTEIFQNKESAFMYCVKRVAENFNFDQIEEEFETKNVAAVVRDGVIKEAMHYYITRTKVYQNLSE